MGARHGGAVPALSLLAGAGLQAALLWFQAQSGMAEGQNRGGSFADLAPGYFDPVTRRLLSGLLAAAMIGWFGFNTGLGGAALGALLGLPGGAGPLLLGLPILALSFGGLNRWNGLATVTTAAALALGGLVALRLAEPASPVTAAPGGLEPMLIDVAALVGYTAVFSLRSPDFAVGFTRRDLAISIALISLPITVFALAGAGLQQGTGSTDLVAVLAGQGALAMGNLLVATAVVAPAFTTVYSGSLALSAATGLGSRTAMGLVTLIGLGLAVARFDRMLGPWLSLLAAVLPPIVIPMATEAARRRRGLAERKLPLWVWAPASAAALGLTAAGHPLAVLAGLAAALVLTGVWVAVGRR